MLTLSRLISWPDLGSQQQACLGHGDLFLLPRSLPIGLFLLPFMYAVEIAPLRTRSEVTAMAASIHLLFGFVIVEVTPLGFANIAWQYYVVYAPISAFAAVMFYLFYPETRGRTLEEIDQIFIQPKSIFDTVRFARDLPLSPLPRLDGDKKVGLETAEVA